MKREITPVPTTVEGLRDALFDELNLLRQGKSTPVRSRAIALMASQIIDSLRVQIQFQRMVIANEKNKPIQIGTPKGD